MRVVGSMVAVVFSNFCTVAPNHPFWVPGWEASSQLLLSSGGSHAWLWWFPAAVVEAYREQVKKYVFWTWKWWSLDGMKLKFAEFLRWTIGLKCDDIHQRWVHMFGSQHFSQKDQPTISERVNIHQLIPQRHLMKISDCSFLFFSGGGGGGSC